jgi:hypothetical protein
MILLVRAPNGRIELAEAYDIPAPAPPSLSSNAGLSIDAAYFKCSLDDLGLSSGKLALGDPHGARALPAPIAARRLALPSPGTWTSEDPVAIDSDLRVLDLQAGHLCQITKARYQTRFSKVLHGSLENEYNGAFARIDAHRALVKLEPTGFYVASQKGIETATVTVDGASPEPAKCVDGPLLSCPPDDFTAAQDGTIFGYRHALHDITSGHLTDGPNGPTVAFQNLGYPPLGDPAIVRFGLSPVAVAPDASEIVVWAITSTESPGPEARTAARFVPGAKAWDPEPRHVAGTLLEHGARDVGPSLAWVGPRNAVATVGTADCRCIARYRDDVLSIEQTEDRVSQVLTSSMGTVAGTWEGEILLNSGTSWNPIVSTASTGGLPVFGMAPLRDGILFSTSAGRTASFIEFSNELGACPADGDVPGRVHGMSFIDGEQRLVVLSQERVSSSTSVYSYAPPVLSVLDRAPPPDCLAP